MEEIRTLTKVVKKEHRRVCRERRLSLALDRGNHEKIIVNLLATAMGGGAGGHACAPICL